MSGVIPPIFASLADPVPGDAARLVRLGARASSGCATSPARCRPASRSTSCCTPALIIFFCFFYTALQYNPKETADNLKKSGAFVPGIRPGDQTARYLEKILTRLTLAGRGLRDARSACCRNS